MISSLLIKGKPNLDSYYFTTRFYQATKTYHAAHATIIVWVAVMAYPWALAREAVELAQKERQALALIR